MNFRSPSIALLLVLSSACAGSPSAPTVAGETARAESEESSLLPTGGCDESSVDADANQIDPRNLPWSFFYASDATVTCEDERVIVDLGPGARIVLASIRDDAESTESTHFRRALLTALVEDFRTMAPDASLSEARETTLGEDQSPALCGRIDFVHEGQPMLTQICAATKRTTGAAHMVAVLITDSEQGFAALDRPLDELMGAFVDSLVIAD